MLDLTRASIIQIHEYALMLHGGPPGIRDEGSLDYIVMRARKEKDPIRNAAILLTLIATLHPFFDGNKRTAFLAADVYLRGCGLYINIQHDEGLAFILALSLGQKKVKEVEEWLRERVFSFTQ